MMLRLFITLSASAVLLSAQAPKEDKSFRTSPVGYTDTPVLPGQTWKVHDIARPHPAVVTPAPSTDPLKPPSDAIVLFDGSDLSKWSTWGKGADKGKMVPAGWKVENGYVEIVPGAGDLVSNEKFGDAQYHIEWSESVKPTGTSQWRGNSGVIIMGLYEIQVLDSYQDLTYADGQAGAIYGQWPPLVNPIAQAGRLERLRHHLGGAEVRGRQAGEARLRHRHLQRRRRTPPQGGHRAHDASPGGYLRPARA